MQESVDILLLTLDAETYLEKCLDSVYREIPVNKVIALDGGSKDKTLEILAKYHPMEVHVRSDIRTTGKCYEFLLSLAATPWIIFMDADIELPVGWYAEMSNYKSDYDFFGCKRIMHYEFYREVPSSIDINSRPQGAPWLAKLECFKGYHVDDDYMWRATDLLLRQVAEKSDYRFGKVATTYHYHHTTDNSMYESDSEKRGSGLVFELPTMKIVDKANWDKRQDNFRKAIIKYIEPKFIYPQNDPSMLSTLLKLDRNYTKENSLIWYNLLENYRRERLRKKLWRTMGLSKNLVLTIKKDLLDYVTNIKET